jgi:hypothetical protein
LQEGAKCRIELCKRDLIGSDADLDFSYAQKLAFNRLIENQLVDTNCRPEFDPRGSG